MGLFGLGLFIVFVGRIFLLDVFFLSWVCLVVGFVGRVFWGGLWGRVFFVVCVFVWLVLFIRGVVWS